MSNSTLTLQTIINLAATHADLVPLSGVGGYTNEPALSLCNDALSELLIFPYDWKFNRVEMPMLVTAPNRQDYQFGGATAFTLGSTSSGVGIGLAANSAITETGTTVTVRFLEPCRFSVGDTMYMTGNTVAAYNSTFTDDGNSATWSGGWVLTAVAANKMSVTFTHSTSSLVPSGSPGITDFGWLSSASMVEMNNTSSPQNICQLDTVKELPLWGRVANPEQVCVLKDNGDGTLKIRFYQVPGSSTWGAKLVYQAKAPLKTSLTNTWAPFPDEYSFVYRQAILYRMYRYLNSSQQNAEYQKLQQEIQRSLAGADREMTDVHVVPVEPLMDFGWGGW